MYKQESVESARTGAALVVAQVVDRNPHRKENAVRKVVSVVVLSLIVLITLALAVGGTAGAGSKGVCWPGRGFGFGKNLAGGWSAVADLGAGPFPNVLTFGADGGIVGSNAPLPGGAFLSTSCGSWRRIGFDRIGVTTLMLIHGADGSLLTYEKVVGELELTGDSLSGRASGYIYGPDQDPLDPDETPIRVLSGTMTASRICVETLGE